MALVEQLATGHARIPRILPAYTLLRAYTLLPAYTLLRAYTFLPAYTWLHTGSN